MSKAGGVRAVASFEAAKGIVVLAAGLGTLEILNHGAQHVAEELVRHLHLNPASRYPRVFLLLANEATPSNLWALAMAAAGYSAMRFAEAYGLWRQHRWAEWFSVISGVIYIPFELWELARGITWLRLALLTINLVIVSYMARVLKSRRNPRPCPS